ncbi:MAG TPA: ATP-dependent DNA helicase RecQ [Candidatus Angelobacter sp.]|jgi:ATP-dependent DNA helicase RecQ|nr:ATP-dependent DNA helicase RecQ [Candidatus Angelobacter sp.]
MTLQPDPPTEPQTIMPAVAAIPPTDALLDALRLSFGHHDFRRGQRDVVEAVLEGHDAVVVMPTGGGKSVCYQLPAVLSGGCTLVVSPLIALMKDQIDALRARGIHAAALHSHLDSGEQHAVQRAYREGVLRLLYVAPERLVRSDFRSLLAQTPPSRIVVDEAHCISEWGHDFRRDYLRIGEVAKNLAPMQVVACTATATPEVRADIAARLELRSPHVVVHGFARPNLHFSVERLRNEAEKLARLDQVLDPGDGHAIVYAGTRARARDLAERLSTRFPTMLYHGDMPPDARTRAQERFVAGDVCVAVTTSAFGMGVDVPTVRQVIHVALPASLEEYYQQAGRAGRDGEPARCVLLHAPADRRLQEFFIEAAHPTPTTLEGVRRSLRDMGGDPGAWSLVTTRHESVRSLSDAAGDAAREILREHGVVENGGGLFEDRRLPAIDHARIATHRRHAYRRFEAMTQYLARPVCRHRQIMEYFGESGAPESCGGSCDVCSRPASVERRLESEMVRHALGLVAHLNGRVGLGRLAGILVGSKSRAVMALHRVTEIPEYGMFQGWREADVQELLHRLVEGGALRQTSPPYPAVALTVEGVAILRGDRTIEVDDPRQPERARERAQPASAKLASEEESARFEKLRAWRIARARERVVPAYVVLPDRTLVDIAARMPGTESELLAIGGVGPAKLALYGQELLRLLDEMRGEPAVQA